MSQPNRTPLTADQILTALQTASTHLQTAQNRPFTILSDHRVTEPLLRTVLARLHSHVLQNRYRASMLELWLKRAKTYGVTYADANDTYERFDAIWHSFAANQDAAERVLVTREQVRQQVERETVELGRLRVVVERLERERGDLYEKERGRGFKREEGKGEEGGMGAVVGCLTSPGGEVIDCSTGASESVLETRREANASIR